MKLADDVNWQQTTTEFSRGDIVTLLNGNQQDVGRVVAVWPAIGMLDVQFATGQTRKPVEEVIKTNGTNPYSPPKAEFAQIPGGAGTVSVSAGPPAKVASVGRVAAAFAKQSLYWANRDRQYRPTRSEVETGQYVCPKCKGSMGMANYQRRDGHSERLLACHSCLFLIKPGDAGMEGSC